MGGTVGMAGIETAGGTMGRTSAGLTGGISYELSQIASWWHAALSSQTHSQRQPAYPQSGNTIIKVTSTKVLIFSSFGFRFTPAGARDQAALEMNVQRQITATDHPYQHHQADKLQSICIQQGIHHLSNVRTVLPGGIRLRCGWFEDPALLAISATTVGRSSALSPRSSSFSRGLHRATSCLAPVFFNIRHGDSLGAGSIVYDGVEQRKRFDSATMAPDYMAGVAEKMADCGLHGTGQCLRVDAEDAQGRLAYWLGGIAPTPKKQRTIDHAGSIPASGPNFKPK